jgi:hypothetical protein
VRLRRAARAKFEPPARHHAQLTTAARLRRAASSITFATPLAPGVYVYHRCRVEPNERHSSRTANKRLRHNDFGYRAEANRAIYEYRCTAREFTALPAIP